MKACDLVAGVVIELPGERLTVTGPPRVERNTAVIVTASATERVTLYLRPSGGVALARPTLDRPAHGNRLRAAAVSPGRAPRGELTARAARPDVEICVRGDRGFLAGHGTK